MAEVTTVEVTDGSVTARFTLTYRWYVPGNDPWQRVAGPVTSMPRSGQWENRAIAGSTSEVRMYDSNLEHIMTLKNFRRISVGSTGDADFYGSGYLFQQYSTLTWEVISVST